MSRVPDLTSLVPSYISSSLFSFNHQHGACPDCDGLGSKTVCDPEKLITHPGRSLVDGAMDGTKTGKFYGDPFGQYMATLKAAGDQHGFDFLQPWNELSAEAKSCALNGTDEEIYDVTWQFRRDNRTGEHHFKGPWIGLANLVNEEYNRKHADHRGESMMALMKPVCCPSCQGSRLREEALGYIIRGNNIAEVSKLSVASAMVFFESLLPHDAGNPVSAVAVPLIGEILCKLGFLSGLGLSYLTIDRIASTLSGGEAQRIKLAGQLGSGLTGLTYVLDEPTIGLHPRDTGKLMTLIRSLQEAGNTIIIVEHDREVILGADHVIDMGPGAGKNGGTIVASGTPREVTGNPDSVTGPYLSADYNYLSGDSPVNDLIIRKSPNSISGPHRALKPGISIKNAFANNLKGFNLEIPSAGIIAITGVSGSGKSTLMFDVILASHENHKPAGCLSIEGFDQFERIVSVHQRTGFSSPLATPATFTGIFDRIRDLYAAMPESKQAGFSKNSFSYLNKDGRCPECEGTGQIKISMDFLSDVQMVCEKCQGKRYRAEILSCRLDGKNIAEILEMTAIEAEQFFPGRKQLTQQLQMLQKVGLGYLQLGQSLSTLSGGESQRLALAAELMNPGKGSTLYLFEEPSTGLHFRDIEYLLTLFHQLADQGNTLLVIEHDPMIIAQADHIIELGPEGGDQGGYLVSVFSR